MPGTGCGSLAHSSIRRNGCPARRSRSMVAAGAAAGCAKGRRGRLREGAPRKLHALGGAGATSAASCWTRVFPAATTRRARPLAAGLSVSLGPARSRAFPLPSLWRRYRESNTAGRDPR
ncbi:hypothetical protein FA09DRAFT_235288 [Tilletiopsis washingtonensis]|uniref:Uncharacterized protein n=1 Tax=Tilletiopsis washingtonensis TaxID=58919 RepID=A0A316ZE10_9BASI|nr:hypothetical protein FA09DRAFT_235288 [Tilletiopsis washingtonensis]PWN99536.1 hypothetical protein FA09DRAFT_235288 [Tilletiopsis washingtonensis]